VRASSIGTIVQRGARVNSGSRSRSPRTGAVEERLSRREIEDIRESTRSFEAPATFGSRMVTWDRGDRREQLPALAVTPQLADVLRIRPVLGRPLLPADAGEAAAPVLLISHELWQARFGVVTCQVAQRTKEFGVRLALGATPRGLASLVLMQAARSHSVDWRSVSRCQW
jgi:hypothetical protein